MRVSILAAVAALFAVVSCAALVAALLAAASFAKGDVLLRKDYLTFSAPFALPGVALPAGSYVFEVIDVNNDKDTPSETWALYKKVSNDAKV